MCEFANKIIIASKSFHMLNFNNFSFLLQINLCYKVDEPILPVFITRAKVL